MGGFNTQPIQSQVAPSPPPPVPQAPQQPSGMPSWFTGNSGVAAPQQPQIAPQAGSMPNLDSALIPPGFGGGGMMSSTGPDGQISVGAGGLPADFNPSVFKMPMSTAGPKAGGMREWQSNGGPIGGPKSGGCGHDQMSATGGQVMPQTLFSM